MPRVLKVDVATGEQQIVEAELGPTVVTPEQRNAQIIASLAEVDIKKVRAITDAILTGDTLRLQQLEAEAAALRAQLV